MDASRSGPAPMDAPAAQDAVREAALAASAAALAALPLAMWLASRSAPLFLAICAVACLIAWMREGAPALRAPLTATKAALRGAPALLALGAFLVFSLVSILWSHDRAASLRAYGELVIPIFSGLAVALILPGRAPRWMPWALVTALIVAMALTSLELRGWNVWRGGFGLRMHTFIFNRTLITALALILPLAAWLIATGRAFAAAALLCVLAGALFVSETGAGKLGLCVAAVAALAVTVAPRLAGGAMAAGLVALFALAPVKGEIANAWLPPVTHELLRNAHSRDRVDIWLSYGEAIRARPLFGSGFGTSPILDRNPVAAEVSPARRVMLAVGHPHSAPVQIWTETGLIGAAASLVTGLLLLGAVMGMRGAWRPAAFGLFAGAMAIASVGHGAWQGWWIAALAASIALFRILMSDAAEQARRKEIGR